MTAAGPAAGGDGALAAVEGNEKVSASLVYRSILQAIRDGRLKPGDKLANERALARQFGTSRATVRGALAMMESQKLISRRVGSGTFLAEDADRIFGRLDGTPMPAHDEVPSFLEILEGRLLFEPEMMALAASRAGPEDFRAMDGHLAQVKDASSWLAFKEAIYAVHGAIFAATRNKFLVQIFADIIGDRRAVRYDGRDTAARVPQAVREQAHTDLSQIVEALKARDARRAETLMKHHLLRTLATVNLYQ